METSKNVKFPYYSGNIKLTKVVGHVTLEDFVNAHAMPKQNTFDILEKVKAATEAGDIALKRTLKHQLYSFRQTFQSTQLHPSESLLTQAL